MNGEQQPFLLYLLFFIYLLYFCLNRSENGTKRYDCIISWQAFFFLLDEKKRFRWRLQTQILQRLSKHDQPPKSDEDPTKSEDV